MNQSAAVIKETPAVALQEPALSIIPDIKVVDSPDNVSVDLHPVIVQQKVVAQKQLEINRNWTGTALTSKLQYQMAKLSVAYGLDPFLGELVCLGDKPYPTVAAIQRKANEDPRFDGEECRPATIEERTAFYFPYEPPADEYLWRCSVWVSDKSRPFIGWGRASVKNVKMSTMQLWLPEMAQKRARGRTYRLAFNIGIPTIEEMYEFEDGTHLAVDPANQIVVKATVEPSGPLATKEQLEMITAHILNEENATADIVTEAEWSGIVDAWNTMTAVIAQKTLHYFLGPQLDGKEGMLAVRKSQTQTT